MHPTSLVNASEVLSSTAICSPHFHVIQCITPPSRWARFAWDVNWTEESQLLNIDHWHMVCIEKYLPMPWHLRTFLLGMLHIQCELLTMIPLHHGIPLGSRNKNLHFLYPNWPGPHCSHLLVWPSLNLPGSHPSQVTAPGSRAVSQSNNQCSALAENCICQMRRPGNLLLIR